MKGKKCYKIAMVFMTAVLSFTCMGNIMAYAASESEEEPNNTFETAQLIDTNRETAIEAAAGSRPNEHANTGWVSEKDEDWLKVYLDAGTQYVTCNGDSYIVEVYDANRKMIMSQNYSKLGFGYTAYSFTADTEGYYYVRLYTERTTSQEYIISVGDPSYSVKKCTVNLSSVTMSNKRDGSSQFDLSAEDILPDGAIAYMLVVGGPKVNDVEQIIVTSESVNKKVTLNKYSWNKNGLAAMNMPLKGSWTITYKYKKDASFTPYINIYYVYPVTSHLYDDVTITR